ncbi:hypothetical protein O181_014250 [Austropuccinia psidii MF-1]|uniref:Uncharacterized protein n=1 Tax=Austropuccinia psidii MF-1 TaxID=1389203 RepID=A0A9Q3GPR0_9BASI|nr:hypothetical protein [Austropuccinia psidii MF-1]
MQYKPKLTYLASLIPAPKQPNKSTRNNILKPLVDELLQLNQTVNIKTYQNSNGRNVSVKLAALIGAIVSTHKVSGFASHSAHCLCSWVEATNKDIEKAVVGKCRNKHNTLELSIRWHNQKQICQHESIVKKTGVRWSELNRLPYWDPSKDVVLGMKEY